MHRFCGGELRVAAVVRNIVDEASGKMLTMNNSCIILEGVAATGEYLGLCPQNELIYWREAWLERLIPTALKNDRRYESLFGAPPPANPARDTNRRKHWKSQRFRRLVLP